MTNEIKEILDRFNYVKKEPNKLSYYPEDLLTREEMWLLYDYITNLQDDYSKAMDLIDKGVENSYKLLKDYKSRNEKAIEYIKQHTEQRIYQEPYNIDGFPDRVEYFIEGKWNLLDILQGE